VAALPSYVPLPPFPRWTGMRVTLGQPSHDGHTLTATVHVPSITCRARLWVAWRMLTRRGVPDAAA
jgi:hypothetical protein